MKIFKLILFLLVLISNLSNLNAYQDFFIEQNYSKKDDKTVLITGGAGFIGSQFLKYMFEKYPKYHFIVLDYLTYAGSLDRIPKYIQESPRFEFVHDTIGNEEIVDRLMAKSHLVVHFAAETHVTRSIKNDVIFLYTDVLGTRVLLNALIKYANSVERFVHISTSEVYGTAEYVPMDEDHPLNPCSPYAAAKVGADRLVYAYCRTFDIPAVIIRPFNNYGPHQHPEKLIPRLITSAIKGESLTIHGTGTQRRDWVHIVDTARAIDSALHCEYFGSIKQGVINIGSGDAISVLDIAKMILKEFDLPLTQLEFISDRPGQVDIHLSSTARSESLLDWKTEVDFEEGLRQTIEWYKKNPELWKKMEKDALIPIVAKDGKVVNQ